MGLLLPLPAWGQPVAPEAGRWAALVEQADALTALLEQHPPAPRPVPPGGADLRETVAATFADCWAQAPEAIQVAYATLAFPLAAKSDQWEQVTGARGSRHQDAYFSALGPLSARALVAVDELRALLDWASPPPECAPGPPLAELAHGLRDLLTTLPPPSPQSGVLGPLLECVGPQLRLSAVRATGRGGQWVITSPFPAVRDGPELALLLTAWGATVAGTQPDGAQLTVLLHEQGLPRLEVRMPAASLRQWFTGAVSLPELWRDWQVADYTEGLALCPAALLLEPPPPPESWLPGPVEACSAAAALEVVAARPPSSAIAIRAAARRRIRTPEGDLYLAAVIGEDPAALRSLLQAAVGPPGAGTSSPATEALALGPVGYLFSGPLAARAQVRAALERVWANPEQPPVQTHPVVLASLSGRPPASTPAPAPAPAAVAPETPLEPFCGPGKVRAQPCRGVDTRQQPQGVTDRFPAGTTEVSLYLEFEAMPPGTEVELQWRHEDRVVLRQILAVAGSQRAVTRINASRGPLRSGQYEVLFLREGREALRVPFRID